MKFRPKARKQIGLDVTPLVDVIFLLLIFFLLTTTFVTSPGIPIDLPTAASDPQAKKPKFIEISLTAKHQVYVQGVLIPKASLQAQLRKEKKQNGELTVLIRADNKARHEMVVYLMDQARRAGLTKLSIATQEGK